jgi:branched-chain amino acid transport system substrate-binding protein
MGGTVHQRSVVRVGASLIVASLALTACGSRSDDNGGGGGSQDQAKTAKIGVIAPLSGDLSALGLGIQHSVELAVKQANESKAIPGWTLEVAAKDDEAKPEPGKNAATALSSDADVIGVVGTLNTSVSQQVQPVLAPKNIVQVSPANTGPGLTQGAKWQTDPQRPYPTYFRTCTTDAVQGPFAARYLFETAGIKKVATITTRRRTARAWSAPSPTSSRSWAVRSSRPRPSTPTTRTSRPSSRPSSRAPRRRCTTAVSTRRPVRSRSR